MSSALVRQRFLSLASTPSWQLQNLSSPHQEASNNLCYIHDADVICMEIDDDFSEPQIVRQSKVDMRGKCLVHQAAYLNIGSTACLGVATDNGFYVWSSGGDRMLWFAGIEAIIAANPGGSKQPDLQFHFARGMASSPIPRSSTGNDEDGGQNTHVFVGSSVGGVCIYTSNGALFKYLSPAQEECAVACLSSSAQYLASADDEGNIRAFSIKNNYKNVMQISTEGTANCTVGKYCTGICTRNSTAIAAFNTGHLRVYNIELGQCVLEIAAHSRCITAMSLHPTEDYIVTCGEDQAINVWTVPNFVPGSSAGASANSTMDLTHCEHWVDSLCTGVTWWHGSYVLCVGYDSNHMFVASHHTRKNTKPEEFHQMKEMSALLHTASTAMDDFCDSK